MATFYELTDGRVINVDHILQIDPPSMGTTYRVYFSGSSVAVIVSQKARDLLVEYLKLNHNFTTAGEASMK